MADDTYTYMPDEISLPGDTLAEMLKERSMTQKELARRMGRPIKTINEIINGKTAVSPGTALQLERVLGAPAHFWNQRESNYREYLVRLAEQQRLEAYVPWLDELPIAEMRKLKILSSSRNKYNLVQEALAFFGVVSPDEWQEVYANPQVAFRRSMPSKSHVGAVATWIRLGEHEASNIPSNPYDAQNFYNALVEIRKLTRVPPNVFVPRMIELCAASGVAVVFVPYIKETRVSGITRWLSPNKAIIQVSLYGKFNDRLWFTFFHEAGHILRHKKSIVFVEGEHTKGGQEEEEANRFAADFLIPPDKSKELKFLQQNKTAVWLFAEDLGIHPGIVVGRMQYEGLLPQSHLNDLKDKFELIRSSEPN